MTRMSVPARRVTALFVTLLLSGLLYGSPAGHGRNARTHANHDATGIGLGLAARSLEHGPPAHVLSTDTAREPAFAPGGAYPAGVRQPDPQNEVVFFVAAESFPVTHSGPKGAVAYITLAIAILVVAFSFLLGAAVRRT
jgi:hypothetical protein